MLVDPNVRSSVCSFSLIDTSTEIRETRTLTALLPRLAKVGYRAIATRSLRLREPAKLRRSAEPPRPLVTNLFLAGSIVTYQLAGDPTTRAQQVGESGDQPTPQSWPRTCPRHPRTPTS